MCLKNSLIRFPLRYAIAIMLVALASMSGCGGGTVGTDGGRFAVSGTVTSSEGVPLDEAQVTLLETGDSGTTSSSGEFAFETSPVDGSATFLVKKSTFEARSLPESIPAQSSKLQVHLVVDPSKPTAVVKDRTIEKRRSPDTDSPTPVSTISPTAPPGGTAAATPTPGGGSAGMVLRMNVTYDNDYYLTQRLLANARLSITSSGTVRTFNLTGSSSNQYRGIVTTIQNSGSFDLYLETPGGNFSGRIIDLPTAATDSYFSLIIRPASGDASASPLPATWEKDSIGVSGGPFETFPQAVLQSGVIIPSGFTPTLPELGAPPSTTPTPGPTPTPTAPPMLSFVVGLFGFEGQSSPGSIRPTNPSGTSRNFGDGYVGDHPWFTDRWLERDSLPSTVHFLLDLSIGRFDLAIVGIDAGSGYVIVELEKTPQNGLAFHRLEYSGRAPAPQIEIQPLP